MITISRNIKFLTSGFIPNRSQEGILAAIKRIKIIYSHRIFLIADFNADSDFEPLWDVIISLNIKLNTVGEYEHVLEVDWCIRTIKEISWVTCNTLTFKKITTRVIVEIVVASTMWINIFPPNDEISTTIIPITLVTGLQVNYKNISILNLEHMFKHTKNTTMGYSPKHLEPFPYVQQETHN